VTSRPAEVQHLRDLARLRRVRDRIDREYAQPLDVEALARGAHMSAGHLSREFKLAYGESPYSYLMTRRIERAMALLRRGDLSVTEVCFAVGCASLGTFSTRFTELVGMPPSTYRSQADRRPRLHRRRAPHHRRDDGQGHLRLDPPGHQGPRRHL
jgi:AraC-like DNA-binding protein